MQDVVSQLVNQAQEVNRSVYEAIEGLAETQFKVMQRLVGVQLNQANQTFEVARDELQLITRVRGPREFASAQAELVKEYGQKYVEDVNEAVEAVSEAWKDYGNRLEQSMNTAAERVQGAARAATRGAKEADESTRKAASSKKAA